MNISKHDQKLILVLLGILIFLGAYFGICKTYNSKRTNTESQISELSVELDTLRAYSADQSSYQSEIDRIGAEINSTLSKYPSDVRSEDLIMFAIELEEKIGINIDSVSVAVPESVSTFSIPRYSRDSYQIVPIAALRTGMTISCALSYEQLKKLIDYVYASSKKSDISNVSVSYNSANGELLGTISIDRYFVASEDYTYAETEIPPVEQGTDNPFGTFTVITDSTEPSASPNAG